MVLDLSLASDSDEERPSGYAAALVSTSLGSDASFRMPSPVRSPSTQRHALTQNDPSPDSSLEELIDSFRASATSLKLFDASPASPKARTRQQRTNPTAGTGKTKGILRHGARVPVPPSSRGEEVIGLSPMPKLTHVPKQKPTLSIAAPSKPSSVSMNKPSSKFQLSKTTHSVGMASKPSVSRLASPKKYTRPTQQTPALRGHDILASPSSLSSDRSTKSSVLEEIDAPDSDDPGEMSVDELISRDLNQLKQLVSSSHERMPSTSQRDTLRDSEAVQRHFSRNTRFHVDDNDECASSFRLHSPHERPPSASSVGLRSVRSLLHRNRDNEIDYQGEQEDSFIDELRSMKAAVLKEKEKKKAEEDQVKKQKEDEAKKKVDEAPAAKIASLREAVDTIDKNLLLALRPFEKLKQEQQQEEAQAAAKQETAEALLELPMATQALVEQLEQTFGGLTRQREAEVKAEEEAIAQAKAAEEAKKKEEDEKKAAEDAARKKQDEEILSLLPMRGKLMNTENDIHDALVRLELAETLAGTALRPVNTGVSASSPDQQLANLREFAARRARDIEELLIAPSYVPRMIDWDRSTFHVNSIDDIEPQIDDQNDNQEPEQGAYSDIVRAGVVEKLDFTILKLKHALSIDKKEAEDAIARQKELDAENAARQKMEADEKNKQAQVQADAEAARQRVMGVSSLEELPWMQETNARLHQGLQDHEALQRLQHSMNGHVHVRVAQCAPSFFDENRAAERFDSVKMMMESPCLLSLHSTPFSSRFTSSGMQSPRMAQRSVNRRYDSIYEGDEPHQTESPRSVMPGYRSRLSSRQSENQNEILSLRRRYVPDDVLKRDDMRYKSRSDQEMHRQPQQNERLVDLKQMIQGFQTNRRHKTRWFHESTRPR